jgi:hypothetical protein
MKTPVIAKRLLAVVLLTMGGPLCSAADAPVAPSAPAAVAAAALEPAVATSSAASAPAAPAAAAAAPAAAPEAAAAPASAPVASSDTTQGLDEKVQDLKKQVVDLNRDLFVLEEELLFPANTQTAIFVSMDVGEFFALDSVVLKIDNREVSNYLYTPREAAALVKGGVQRLYVGNLKAGPHELVALFTGKGPNERDYRRGASVKFEKGIGAKYLELKISDRARKAQPEFVIKDWE